MRTCCLVGILALCIPGLAVSAEKVVVFGEANLKEPFQMDFAPDGSLIVPEFAGHRILKFDASGKRTLVAGTGMKGHAGGPGNEASFNGPHNVAVARNGDIYVSDTVNHLVRRIDGKSGIVDTIAGTGKKGFGGDGGPGKDASFDQTYHVALDASETNLYICDLGNKRIRKLDLKNDIITTVVGNGMRGVPVDGTKATEAPLVDPRACALDRKGNLYILERGGHALRVVKDGKIYTVVGTGKAGAEGDGGPGTKATLNGPKCLWIDKNDDVLIADAENNLIRKYVAKDGTIVRIAGTGKKGSAGIEKGLLGMELARPHGVAVAPDGTLYIADSYNNRLLKVTK